MPAASSSISFDPNIFLKVPGMVSLDAARLCLLRGLRLHVSNTMPGQVACFTNYQAASLRAVLSGAGCPAGGSLMWGMRTREVAFCNLYTQSLHWQRW